MFFVPVIFFAAATLRFLEELEDEELAMAEQATVIEQDDEAEDGELIFDSEEIISELDDEK